VGKVNNNEFESLNYFVVWDLRKLNPFSTWSNRTK
jgi:hypothetical protein